ncbi:hypothetical protein GIB67_020921 [Kingdonia uniflora]|uniref:Gnk2-homologous domain-containing protein n=1 Tax=Kingdonia uniflora TaxID=39325 RepID=A0A7J7M7W4_9MAGN|nr:hypothetical protein GIB67_020921 [Kingdonia uniflora]
MVHLFLQLYIPAFPKHTKAPDISFFFFSEEKLTMSKRPFLLSFLVILFISMYPTSESSSDTFVYGGCSQLKYNSGSPFETNLNSLLTSLVNSATFSSYSNFTITGSSPQDVVYGLYQCRGDLSMPDCAMCIAHSVNQLGLYCPQSCGGALQLQGCFIKYDNATFLGAEDKNVVLKKCGPIIGYDVGIISQRDAVLDGLGSGGGPYRVGGSGKVQGMGQCVGDLSLNECQSCITEAIQRLKTDCGGAVSGDVFLGKCYARYSLGGADSRAGGSGGKDDDDDAEKALAITIGLLAGVAVIVIFLSLVRKACQSKGK